MSKQETPDTYTLFMHAVDVTNASLAEHSDRAIYNQLLKGAERLLSGRELGVGVYKTNPEDSYDYYTLRFNNGKFELAARGKESPDIDWRVSQDYLENVYKDPDRYIENPLLLDIDWLKSRLKS